MPFLVFADSTVQDPGLPIRLQECDLSCDKAIVLCKTMYTIPYYSVVLDYVRVMISMSAVWHGRLDDDATVHGIGSLHDCY